MAILKLFHVFFVFVWVGTLLSLIHFLIASIQEKPPVQQRFLQALRKIYWRVDFPALLGTVLTGVTLLILKDINWKAPWLHMKLTFAFLLILCDLIVGKFTRSQKLLPEKKWRYYVIQGVTLIIFLTILGAIYIVKTRV